MSHILRVGTSATLLTLLATGTAPAQAPAPATLAPTVTRYVSVNAPVVAITNVLVIDGTGGAAKPAHTVIIRDGRIETVGPTTKVTPPAGATIIDGAGHTLIPGIIGLHDHLYYSASGGRSLQMSFTGPRLYLAGGVTTVRTTGSQSPYADINLKRNIDAGNVPGPRIFVTTPYLTGPGGGGAMSVATTPEEARRFVAYWAEEGAAWIKFYASISREAMKAAIDEGHKRGMRATGHLCSVTFREAVDLGIDDLAHGALTATDFHPRKEPDKCPQDAYAAVDTAVSAQGPIATSLIEHMVKHKVSMTTTMAVFELFYPGRPVTDERVLDLMAPEVRTAYVAERAYIDTMKNSPLQEAGFKRALAFDKAFYDAGGVLASGVDPTGNGGALPGFGDQRGYELLREGGFGTEQAVQVLTLNGARVLGVADQWGSIEKGKKADLVLLKGDLTAETTVIRNPVTVFKDGIGYDSGKLIAAVRGRVGIN
ncbi:MAG TPA: amidohydrolase family protein [Gemmatimonadales bacterium]|nr:amidohydrolase family protein [Gemmatimonadales bacterium]